MHNIVSRCNTLIFCDTMKERNNCMFSIPSAGLLVDKPFEVLGVSGIMLILMFRILYQKLFLSEYYHRRLIELKILYINNGKLLTYLSCYERLVEILNRYLFHIFQHFSEKVEVINEHCIGHFIERIKG